MDYKEKYENALERARNIRFGNPSSATANVVCEEIFPELKESEDENIRRFLIDFIKVCGWSEKQFPPREDVLHWLEKQGEQKPTDSYCKENCKGYKETGKCFADGECKAKREVEQKPACSKEDENIIDDLTQTISQYTVFAHREPKEIIQWLKSLKPQSH